MREAGSSAMVGDLPYPQPTSAAASAVMRANRKTGSSPEVRLRQALYRSGLRFRKNHRIQLHSALLLPDVAFTKQKVAVFVDGCFWHGCPEHGNIPRANSTYWKPKLERNIVRDRRNDVALMQAGWKVLRIWEHTPADEACRLVIRLLST